MRIFFDRLPKNWVGNFPSVTIKYRNGELNNNDRIKITEGMEALLKPFESKIIFPEENNLFKTLSENLKP